MEALMFRDFLNNFILTPWRLDIEPHLEDLGQSSLFWSIVAVLVVGLLLYRSVRKR
jgi:hypothetical protein